MSYWNNDQLATDEKWMRYALEQGENVKGITGNNPHVGCVIVHHNQLLASGATQPPGQHHAEVHAINNALAQSHTLAGSTFYCTLEPCCCFGRTPPCTDAIIHAQPQRIVIAMIDPFPQMRGQGIQILQQAGIEVLVGVCELEARQSLAFWIKQWE